MIHVIIELAFKGGTVTDETGVGLLDEVEGLQLEEDQTLEFIGTTVGPPVPELLEGYATVFIDVEVYEYLFIRVRKRGFYRKDTR